MEKETYSYEEFAYELKKEFGKYAGEDSDDNTYTEGYFNNFLKEIASEIAGDETTTATTTTEPKAEEQPTGIRDLNIAVQPDPIVCTVFNHNVTKSEMLILNTMLNLAMFAIAAVTFVKIRRA